MTLPFNTDIARSACAATLSGAHVGLAILALTGGAPAWAAVTMAILAAFYAWAAWAAFRRYQRPRPINPYLTGPETEVAWEEVR